MPLSHSDTEGEEDDDDHKELEPHKWSTASSESQAKSWATDVPEWRIGTADDDDPDDNKEAEPNQSTLTVWSWAVPKKKKNGVFPD